MSDRKQARICGRAFLPLILNDTRPAASIVTFFVLKCVILYKFSVILYLFTSMVPLFFKL